MEAEGERRGPGRATGTPASPPRIAPAIGFLLALGFSLAAPSRVMGRAVARVSPDPPAVAAVLGRHRIPSAVVGLVEAGGLSWSYAHGQVSRGGRQPVGPETLFRVGSISKVVVALALARALSERGLDLDTPVGRVLPDLRISNPWADLAPVTAAHLLEHASGLEDAHSDEVLAPAKAPRPSVLEVLERHPERLRIQWRPGTRFAYSNRGTMVAARMVERLTGLPFEAAARALVLDPAGLHSTRFSLGPPEEALLADGYQAGHAALTEKRSPWFWAAADMVSTPRDLGRLTALLADGGRLQGVQVLPEELVRRAETPTSTLAAGAGIRVGAGAGLSLRPSPWGRLAGHYGGGYGGMALFRYLPGTGRGYLLILTCACCEQAFHQLQVVLQEAAFEGLPRLPPAPPVPDPERSARIGSYRAANPWYPSTRVLDALSDGLLVTSSTPDQDPGLVAWPMAREPVPLVSLGEGRYRARDAPEATHAFVADDRGRAVLVGGDAYFVRTRLPRAWILRSALATAVLLVIVSWPARWRSRRPGPGGRALRMADLATGIGLALASGLEYQDLGSVGPRTLGIWAATWLQPLCASLGLLTCLADLVAGRKADSPPHLAAALGHAALALHLAASGAVGFRLWVD